MVRKHWDGIVIGVGELTPQIAEDSLANGEIQLAAFGRLLLSNADFVKRLKENQEMEDYNSKTDLPYLK